MLFAQPQPSKDSHQNNQSKNKPAHNHIYVFKKSASSSFCIIYNLLRNWLLGKIIVLVIYVDIYIVSLGANIKRYWLKRRTVGKRWN